jgi:phosphotransferase system enzyme I (PtsP)
MITSLSELKEARVLVQRAAARTGLAAPPPLGVMIEVPSLLWQLPALCRRVDFVSVGTNDLLQFLFACDRGNPRLADRYDPLSAPMLALFRELVAQTSAAGVPLSMCGEMAGSPIEAMALIALGFRALSMTAAALGPVKTMIRSLDAGALSRYLDDIGTRPDHSFRPKLEAYARDHGVVL